jgi:hypothetical protein
MTTDPLPSDSSQDPSSKVGKIFQQAFGSEAEVDKMTAGELTASLTSMGVQTDAGWAKLQAQLKVAQGKARLAEGRARRGEHFGLRQAMSRAAETKEKIIEEIQGLLKLSGGGAAVYARKWEETSVEDLKTLRDALARTAARAGKKRDGKAF